LEKALNNGQIFILDIDVKGALKVMEQYPGKNISFFIDIPGMDILEKRLRGRGTETEAQIQKRLSRIPEECKEKEKFDHNIINDKLGVAVDEIETLIMNKLEAIQ
jgi:guanylate kinase